MSTRTGRVALLGILLILLGVFWYTALLTGLRLQSAPDTVSLRYHSPSFDTEKLGELRRIEGKSLQERLAFCASFELEGQEIKSKDLGRKAVLPLLLYHGNPRLLLPERLLLGKLPSEGETSGCAIDEAVADRLWGSANVVGETLVFQKKEYTVLGVLKGKGGAVLLPAAAGEARFVNLSLDVSDSSNPRRSAQSFVARHALEQPDAVISSAALPAFARFFILLPAILGALCLLWVLLREVWEIRGQPVLFGLYLAGIVLIAALGVLLGGFNLSFPQNLVPTRWSDFSFWQRTLSTALANLQGGLSARKLLPDRILMGDLFGLIAASFAACLCLGGVIKTAKTKNHP